VSARLEVFLAKLYVDDEAYRRFVADPAGEMARAALDRDEKGALEKVDLEGLALARASIRHKRMK
jgi:hypothetical protein